MGWMRRLVLGSAVLLLVVAGVLPVALMVAGSLAPGGQLGLGAYRGLLASPRQWRLVGNSLTLAALTTLGTVLLGVPAGILVGRTDLPGRRALAALLAMPLLLPPYLIALGWMAAGARGGAVARLLGDATAASFSHLIFGLPGTVLVLTTAFMPLVMLLVAASLRSVPPALEEAGLTVARWPVVMRRISLPLVLPGLLLGAALVFLLALGEISVPPTLRYPVFAVESLSQFSAFYDLTAATAAAMPLAALTAVVLGLEAVLARRVGGRGVVSPPAARRVLVVPLGRWRWPAAAAAWSVAAGLVGAPLAVLARRAGGPASYLEALHAAGDSLARGLALAAVGGTLLAAVGFLLAVLVLERPRGVGAAVDGVALFLFAVPGGVLGVGLIVLWNRPRADLVYATPLILLLGYVARYTAVALRLNLGSLELVPRAPVEAARVAGIGWGRRLLWVVAPAAWRGLAAAWLAGAVFCLRDVGLTLLVHPPGWDTLPVRIMTLAANGAPSLIAAACMILVAATVVPVALLSLVLGRRGVAR